MIYPRARWLLSPAVFTLTTLPLGACFLDPGDCTSEARWGLRVEVRDQQTGSPAGSGAVVRAEAVGHSEILQPLSDLLTFVGAVELPGLVETVSVEARLQPR